jgi:hypothetical protein
MKLHQMKPLAILGLSLLLSPLSASAAGTAYLDDLQVNKCLGGTNNTDCAMQTLYHDDFNDGVFTPFNYTTGNAASYINTVGSFTESGGKLALGGDNSVQSTNNINSSAPDLMLNMFRLGNPSANTANNLGSGRSFSAIATFDLTAPSTDNERYGIRLVDYGTSGGVQGNDLFDLTVARVGGQMQVQARDLMASNTNADDFVLGSDNLSAGGQIWLQLAYSTDTTLVSALYSLDNVNYTTLASASTGPGGVLFSDEGRTILQVYATAPVPEPADWAMMAIGLVVLAAVQRRRMTA